jgi:catechol 2,3-dioxygenase-like lactoylglutathione lyase family enzyme
MTGKGNNGEEAPRWRGVNHLAMVTPDMDATVRFYHGVLGMRLVATLRAGPMRHYFFELGAENTIAFFEVRDSLPFALPAGVPDPRKAQFDHVSFNLADEEALHALSRRLKAAGCEVTDVIEHGIVRSIYFHDNNGIALEASWWEIDVTGRPAIYDDADVFADPSPVPAVRELARDGAIGATPRTELAGDRVVDPV